LAIDDTVAAIRPLQAVRSGLVALYGNDARETVEAEDSLSHAASLKIGRATYGTGADEAGCS
jgi:hypothetical protein